jgi:hypothetical protein
LLPPSQITTSASRSACRRIEVAVRHRVAHERHPEPGVDQRPADLAARLALAATRADCADGDDRLRGAQHRRVGPEEPEVGAGGERDRRLVHDRLVLQVGVGEDDLVDAVLADEVGQLLLGADRDAVRVQRPGQGRRVDPVGDAGDLGCREGDHLRVGVVTEYHVEVVEVATAGSHDDDLAHGQLRAGSASFSRASGRSAICDASSSR